MKWPAQILRPAAGLYNMARSFHYGVRAQRPVFNPKVPVICIGNITAGGAGKTPCVLKLYDVLVGMGRCPAILSRGYGGTLSGPVLVNGDHDAKQVGDEPAMMAHMGKTVWISKDRIKGIIEAQKSADLILMDDGFQNPQVTKALSFIVFDGPRGIGNGYMMPAGPLREPVCKAINRADGIIVIGAPNKSLNRVLDAQNDQKLLAADIVPDKKIIKKLKGKKITAFAGIGIPNKFFDMLRECNLDLVDQLPFADHHEYSSNDIDQICKKAGENVIVTTEKDFARLPEHFKKNVTPIAIDLAFLNEAKINTILKSKI